MINVLIIVFCVAAAIQVVFWGIVFMKLALHRPLSTENIQNDTAILIAARNESQNLKKNLPRILSQKYRSHMVTVVDDNSSDTTPDLLLDMRDSYPNLAFITYLRKQNTKSGKKHALTHAIEKLENDVLLLTDADCIPASTMWLQKMQAKIVGPIEIVLGYSPFKKRKGLLNAFIRWEGVYTAIQYFSLALWGIPYMGVGRNLCYKRTLFNATNGFESHDTILSGDDDLFINAVANKSNTAIQLDPDTFIWTDAPHDLKSYFRQKRRHFSTGKYYRPIHQFILGLLSLSHFVFHLGGLCLIFSTEFALIIYAARFIVVWIVSMLVLRKLKQLDLLIHFLFFDFLLNIYFLIFLPAIIFNKNKEWK